MEVRITLYEVQKPGPMPPSLSKSDFLKFYNQNILFVPIDNGEPNTRASIFELYIDDCVVRTKAFYDEIDESVIRQIINDKYGISEINFPISYIRNYETTECIMQAYLTYSVTITNEAFASMKITKKCECAAFKATALVSVEGDVKKIFNSSYSTPPITAPHFNLYTGTLLSNILTTDDIEFSNKEAFKLKYFAQKEKKTMCLLIEYEPFLSYPLIAQKNDKPM